MATSSVTGPEPVRAAAESVAVPVAAESAMEPETTTAAEASPSTAEVDIVAPTEADVPVARKAQPEESSTATESTTEPEATPTSAEPVPATTEATPVPDRTAVQEPQKITAPLHEPEVVAAPVSDEVTPLVDVPKAEDAPAIVVEEPEVEELVVEANIVKDETPAPVLWRTSPVAINETLAPEPNPPTGSLLEATAVDHVQVTDTPIVVKGEKVTGVECAAIAEPAVEEQVVDAKLEAIEPNDPEPLIEPVPTTDVENVKPVESLSVVQRSLREFAPVSQELAPEPCVESTPVMTGSTDAAEVDEIKPLSPGVTCEVGKPSGSELKAGEIVEPSPIAVVAPVEARAPPAASVPVATEPSPVVDEVTLTKEHEHGEAEANGSTTTDPGARDQISTNGHRAPTAATTSTQEGATHAEKFPSASASHPVSEDNTPSSSKFNSTRKKRTSIFGKLKNIFHQDKEKEKK
jgi:hypothetical protein